jgi:hypothetical protein
MKTKQARNLALHTLASRNQDFLALRTIASRNQDFLEDCARALFLGLPLAPGASYTDLFTLEAVTGIRETSHPSIWLDELTLFALDQGLDSKPLKAIYESSARPGMASTSTKGTP